MKIIRDILLLTVLLLLVRTAAANDAIVRIQAGAARGSGAIVLSNDQYGVVVTNAHVIRGEPASSMYVVTRYGRQAAAPMRSNERDDLAVLLIQWDRYEPLQPIKIAETMPSVGQPVTMAGYGGNRQLRYANGRLTGQLFGNSSQWSSMIGATAVGGDSGGPVLNQAGELVGVLWGSLPGDVTFARLPQVRQTIDTAVRSYKQTQCFNGRCYAPPRMVPVQPRPAQPPAPPRQGLPGPPGAAGQDGSDGADGLDGQDGANGADGVDGQDGSDGASAYQIAVESGYNGTVEQWLESLKGADGQHGIDADVGQIGFWYRVLDIDGSIVTPETWIPISRLGDPPTSRNMMTIKKVPRKPKATN